MNSIKRAAAVAAIACVAMLGASPAPADVISNPTNTDSFCIFPALCKVVSRRSSWDRRLPPQSPAYLRTFSLP